MNTTVKRLSVVLIALTLVAAACGGRDDDSSSSDNGGSDSSGESASGAFINPDKDCTDYKGTQGITGDTIKIGTIRPAAGPYAIYDQVTAGMEAYFKSQNSAGGVKAGDGKTYKIELVKGDDGYDPARTPAIAKQLVEQDQVFGFVGNIGTEPSLAIRDYLNDNCVPNMGLGTGSPLWGDANAYPWYISALPSYALEAKVWVDYIEKTNPKAKIAMLYQSDDFGESYQKAVKKDIEGTDMTLVEDQSFNPLGGTTTEAAVTQLSQSGADVFIVGIGGTPCPSTLKFMPDSWKPLTFISITCAGKTALSLAGGKDQGVYAAQTTYDPSDPADQSNPKVVEFVQQATAAGLSQQQIEGGISSAGWGFGALFTTALEQTKTVDRAGVMNALFALDVPAFGLLRDDVTVQTNGAEDPWGIESLRVVQREGQGWVEKEKMVDYNGKSNSLKG